MISLLEVYRFLNSFLLISVEGGFPERFLNLCSREKIYLWDVTFENKKVKAKIYSKDFYKLKSIRSKCGVKIKIVKKRGLTFSIKAHKKRSVLLAGMISALIFMYSMNQFVWFIDVRGNESLNKAEIISSAKELGLKAGTFAPIFDKNGAGREIVNLFDGKLLWGSVNIKGSKAVIEIREYTEKEPEKEENSDPCNIIADFDGVIITNETYEGISNTAKGNAVKKGDILISGISENTDSSVNFHNADGKLSAYHKRALSYSSCFDNNIYKLSKGYDFNTITIFSLNIPLSLKAFSSKEERYEYTEFLNINNNTFPFGVTKSSNTVKTTSNSAETKELYALDEFTKLEYSSLKNTMIISSDYKIIREDYGYSITAEYECIDFIGKKSNILKEN